MRRSLKLLFFAIEVNLLLWLAAAGTAWSEPVGRAAVMPIIVGTAFAAIVQHWAYYAVYRKAKQM